MKDTRATRRKVKQSLQRYKLYTIDDLLEEEELEEELLKKETIKKPKRKLEDEE